MAPADEKALLQQGIAAARAGDKTTARTRFRELTARNFDNELAWLWLASVADTPAHAIACLRRVLQINPAHDKAKPALFRVLMEGGIQTARGGDKPAAYTAFTECSTLDPGSELVWTWMASTAPSPRQALDALRRVLQINPAHDQAGRAYRKLIVQHAVDLAQGNDANARTILLEASNADPQNENVWLWLARMSPADDAVGYYERVLELNPDHAIARAALEELRPTPIPEPEPEPDLQPEPVGMGIGVVGVGSGRSVHSLDALAAQMLSLESDTPEPEAEPELTLGPPSIALGDVDESAMIALPPGPNDDGMVVEQFVRQQGSVAGSANTQAATHEEFQVYQNNETTTSWTPPSSSASAHAIAYEEETAHDIAAVEDEGAEFADAMTLQSDVDASGVQESEVDSYVAGAESTYASSELVASANLRVDESGEVDAELTALDGEPDAMLVGAAAAEVGNTAIAAPPAPPSNEPIAWNCPICLSGAPESARRCPTCFSVPSLLDPDLLLETDPVDRRHVLQVVARLKNRKVAGSQQFDHLFALGLAYMNAGKVAEGVQQLRAASQLKPNDRELKAQIDSVERRAQARAKSLSNANKPPKAVNGSKARAPEPPMELPIAPAEESHQSLHESAGDAPLHNGNGHGHNSDRRIILVVDDSPTIQKVVSVTLEAHGHEVVTASDGMEALAKLRTLKPDLVLLDITMPHMDGYQLCRILRSNDLTRQVPIVMLSGKDGLFDKMRGRMAGAASYITKPFAPSALPPLIDKYCKRAS